jgi:hypothetical protein
MSRPILPWGVHSVHSMFAGPGVQAGLKDGRWVTAVAEPYHTFGAERLRAAWWVLTGRAHAVVWPKDGDLEDAIAPRGPRVNFYAPASHGREGAE